MLFLYDLGIRFYYLLILVISPLNKKANRWLSGRKNIFQHIKNVVKNDSHPIWFHFASLGEFEQGRPVLETVKQRYPNQSIIVTFFSPSGYEVRNNYELADHVFYLPLDTKKNATRFIKIIKPDAAIFTKYEYWYHYFNQLQRNNIPLLLISGLFRTNQPFFKWYGGLHRKMLSKVSHFFVQNKQSRELLTGINIKNVSVTGDTRFDRVIKNSANVQNIPMLDNFLQNSRVFIAGSTWVPDEEIILPLTSLYPDWKFIIAPHEVHPPRISQLEVMFTDCVKYSELNDLSQHQVLIVDNIGMLSALYQYGDIAYIGGGFGQGIHNTQEAAAFGLPVIFGPRYRKFREALELVEAGAFFPVRNSEEITTVMQTLTVPEETKRCGDLARAYIMANAGATDLIMDYLERSIFKAS